MKEYFIKSCFWVKVPDLGCHTNNSINSVAKPKIMNIQKITVAAYEEFADLFTLSVVCDPADKAGWVDIDDFVVPGLVLPRLIGVSGEPDELVGQTFEVDLDQY